MGKTMLLATVIVVGIAVIYGLEGVLWMRVLAVPMGIVLWAIGTMMGWME